MAVLEGLMPKNVFCFFEEICGIPHGSGNTEKISSYLVDFAKRKKFSYIQDELGNVIIFKDGTAGYENADAVIIQGHIDMVCEKDTDSNIDFAADGLILETDGERIWAHGTTLGGDDGIAVAIMLAILDAPAGSINHPPIEAVFTVDEEIGMLGASYMDCAPLKGKTMLNLDSEKEGVLLVSCAGGATACGSILLDSEEVSTDKKAFCELTVSGCTGGHSGIEIDKQRANAIKVLGRCLNAIMAKFDLRISDIYGGAKDNAIPVKAGAFFLVDESDVECLTSAVSEWNEVIRNEYAGTDTGIELNLIIADDVTERLNVLKKESADTAIKTIVLSPNGVRRMSDDMEGMVLTSLNLGILNLIDTEDGKKTIRICYCIRSGMRSQKEELIEEIRSLMKLVGGDLSISGDYPAWEYVKSSKLISLMSKRFETMFGKKPVVESVHAGVECGIFAGKIAGLDCVSIGPNMHGIHTTSETLFVSSVKRTYAFVLDVLEHL